MAVKWAVANGSWSVGATWNDGTLPTNGDIIYLNGHTLNKAAYDINLPNAILTNESNAEYGIVAGGYINMNNYNYNNITINLRASGTYVYYLSDQTSNRNFTINGNVEVVDNCTPLHYYINSSNIRIIINGNISLKNLPLIVRSGGNVVHTETIINGNVTGEQGSTIYSYSTSGSVLINGNVNNVSITQTSVTINGNLSLIDNNFTTSNQTLTVNGNLSLLNGHYINCGTLNYSGSAITYSGYASGSIGNIKCANILFSDTNNLIWRDISAVRTAPFIILTDAEMNNRQQYPPENEVKEGTEYVWGEKVGTYQQPPESVVLKDFVYDTIIAEENDIATYNAVRYIYADYGTLHWFELKTTTTDIVTDPTSQSIDIDGDTVVADTDYIVEYNDVCYQWSGSAWGSITTKNIGTVKTDIVTNPTETTLCTKKGSLEVVNLPQTTLDRMANTLTIDIFQQILDAHLNN